MGAPAPQLPLPTPACHEEESGGAVCSSQGVRSGSRQAGPLRTDATWAVLMPYLFLSSWQGGEVQLATPSLSRLSSFKAQLKSPPPGSHPVLFSNLLDEVSQRQQPSLYFSGISPTQSPVCPAQDRAYGKLR